MPPEGSSEITTSIGGRCKAREGFSRSVLISREAWPVFLRCTSLCHPRLVSIVIRFGVAMAEGKHLFPFRTEKLSPPAPMVLPGRPGGRVGRRPIYSTGSDAKSRGPIFLLGPPASTRRRSVVSTARSGPRRSGRPYEGGHPRRTRPRCASGATHLPRAPPTPCASVPATPPCGTAPAFAP